MKKNIYKKFHLVSVDMGYGHQRASYPFLDLAEGGVITANNYPGASDEEKSIWENDKRNYDKISRFKSFPFLGNIIFSAMDHFQRIEPFYPKRDLSDNSLQQKHFFKKVKNGMGKNLIRDLNKNPIPLVTTFFVAAYFAEHYNYQGDIYCIVCDADISRAWAPISPRESKIKYLAPNKRVKERLVLYGVKEENVYITGFPLPKENVGAKKEIVKEDLINRLPSLDPSGAYRKKYEKILESFVCPVAEIKNIERPLSLMFAVGGAGAQKDVGEIVIKRLKNKIDEGKINLKIVAGSRREVFDYYKELIKTELLENSKNISIIYNEDKMEYFKEFNQELRKTDILYTKPSELSFYAGLGLPILMTEPLGSQEHYNRRWLLGVGAGIDGKNPKYIDDWLFDFLDAGWFAEASVRGFLNSPKMGTYNIEDIVLKNKISEVDNNKVIQ